MPEEQLDPLHTAVDCYLSSLLAMANCLGEACPETGGLYRQRLSRLRARLAFDTSPDAMQESSQAVEAELKEFASKTSNYIDQHGFQLESAVQSLDQIVRSLVQRQDFYSARLRQFAAQMEADASGEHASNLLSCVESMTHETHSLIVRMQNELAAVEHRLREAEITDPVTGLMNRREMERKIEARTSQGEVPVLLHFQLSGNIDDEIAKQVAVRLASKFRPKDFVSRWTDSEFMVLFQGPLEIAQMRAEQIVPWIAGRYILDRGEAVQVGVDVRFTAPELAA